MGETPAWVIDALDAQLRRVDETLATLERLRGALASTGEGMLWRSSAAEHFHRLVVVRVASIDGLTLALSELGESVRRARVRALRGEERGL